MVRLVASRALATQEEIARALARDGFTASQASISRDIAALGLVKAGGRWARTPAVAAADPLSAKIGAAVLSVKAAGPHLLVLSTPPGEASPVAIAIDHMGWPGIVGTIAGDDTIFVAIDGARAAAEVRRRLRRLGALP
jgi:transcriptional regulator of arginine metabolism